MEGIFGRKRVNCGKHFGTLPNRQQLISSVVPNYAIVFFFFISTFLSFPFSVCGDPLKRKYNVDAQSVTCFLLQILLAYVIFSVFLFLFGIGIKFLFQMLNLGKANVFFCRCRSGFSLFFQFVGSHFLCFYWHGCLLFDCDEI